MDKPRDETIECAGLALAIRRWGAADAPVRLIALHGWLDNAASFEPLAEHLPASVQLVCLDFPGHGQSDWLPAAAEYHYIDWLTWVDRCASTLGWDRFTLLGHSMGAGVAALYAGAHPDRVERLVLLDGLGPYTNPAADAPANVATALRERRRVKNREPRVFESVEQATTRKLVALPYLGDAMARLLMERGTAPCDGGVRYAHDPRLVGRSMLRLTEEQVLAFLRSVAAPTLVVRPRDGLDYPDGHGGATERVAALRDAQVLEIDGHHHVHLTNPERVAGPLVEFLEQ